VVVVKTWGGRGHLKALSIDTLFWVQALIFYKIVMGAKKVVRVSE